MKDKLRGVIAAAATPIDENLQPDLDRFITLCRWLLENGCDGLNICGTTGEATSFAASQRMSIMSAAASALPGEQLMVGTGAAAVEDAVTLTRHAAELGFAGALVLPPFYYKGVNDDGIVRYIARIVHATAHQPIDIYLYNFPGLSGVPYTPALVRRLRQEFGARIAGLKDSSGDLPYASEVASISKDLRVFPSNEAVLLKARAGEFAGCISASANVTASWCKRAYHLGDEAALEKAIRIRGMVSRNALVSSIKSVLAYRFNDPAYKSVLPPLTLLSEEEEQGLIGDVVPLLSDQAS